MKQLIHHREQFMNSNQAELYQRIQAFSLDVADASLPFSKRLARDNGWTIKYARRVIDEYKKFMFLAVVADHPVTPSEQVDQAWHLHLLYTHSYWEEFCPHILQTPLHHGPTQGGQNEGRKFDDWYNKTLTIYEQFFQQSPPIDIWPPSHIRFGRDIHFVRVNTQENWIFFKARLNLLPQFRRSRSPIFVLSLFLAFALTGCALSGALVINSLLWLFWLFLCFLWLFIVSSRGTYRSSSSQYKGGYRRNSSLDLNIGGGNAGDSYCGDSSDSGYSGNAGDSYCGDSSDSGCGGGDSGCGGGGCGGCGGCGD